MFKKFISFVKDEKAANINSSKDFLSQMSGKRFLNGMYRFFLTDQVAKWNEIVEQAFPLYKNRITVFSYDWLGRIFALNKQTDTVLLFEPGTGEVLDIPVDIINFHDTEIVEYHEDCLASEFFHEWFIKNDKYILPNDKCAGYKVPLFLNGDDDVENLEVSDMEVYWEIMMPLIKI